ncbi:MAG TPA: cation:proton antiporter [Vicingaceae bacterium]|nr:cation:proton antiporter [Vicingaceae bacterium]
MTYPIIISVCALIIIAYLFDLTAPKTKIPSVILLLSVGWASNQLLQFLNISIPDLSSLLPIFGTIGLILIVLEGSLELELKRENFPLIRKSIIASLIQTVGLSFLLAYAFYYFGDYSYKDSLLNAIPLSIISSAIAIPSVKNITKSSKEFIIYESSLSDIFGVIFFDFIALNDTIDAAAFGSFAVQILVIILISFVATLGLAFLLSKIKNHTKFIPILILLITIYAISKMFHLPALIFILLFGIILGNLDELKNIKWINKAQPEKLNTEVMKFKEIVMEGTFLIRTIFFLLFGFMMNTAEIINEESLLWSIGIVGAIFIFRLIQLLFSKLPLRPLLMIAPRGLITILLFLAISSEQTIDLVNKPLIIQVIILTSFIMMLGLITNKREKKEKKTVENL